MSNSKPGGKREGSGRKRSENKKIRISFSLAHDVVDYLNSRKDKPKAQVIEDGLRLLERQETSTEFFEECWPFNKTKA